jgi:hypothetical protein
LEAVGIGGRGKRPWEQCARACRVRAAGRAGRSASAAELVSWFFLSAGTRVGAGERAGLTHSHPGDRDTGGDGVPWPGLGAGRR